MDGSEKGSFGEGLSGPGWGGGRGRPPDGGHEVAGREGKEDEGGEMAVRGAGVAPWCDWEEHQSAGQARYHAPAEAPAISGVRPAKHRLRQPSNSIGAARATNSPVGPVYGRRNGMRHSLNRLM